MTATRTPRTYEEVTAHRAAMRDTFERALREMLAVAFDGDDDMTETVVRGVMNDATGFGPAKVTELGEWLTPRPLPGSGSDEPRPWSEADIRAQRERLARLVTADWFRPAVARTDSGVAFGIMRRIELALRAHLNGR